MAARLWATWSARNEALWNNKIWSANYLKGFVESCVSSWQQNYFPNTRPLHEVHNAAPVMWSPPPMGMLKCNVDASLHQNGLGFGAVIRDHAGQFVAANIGRLRRCIPSAMESVKKIQDEQRDYGNNDMVVIEKETLEVPEYEESLSEDNNEDAKKSSSPCFKLGRILQQAIVAIEEALVKIKNEYKLQETKKSSLDDVPRSEVDSSKPPASDSDKKMVGEEWELEDEVFSQLIYLEINSIDLEQWKAGSHNFPELERLLLYQCKKLEEIPPDLFNTNTLN
nr:disease resistance protein RPP13-like isoform X3 [Ipomoea batatas]